MTGGVLSGGYMSGGFCLGGFVLEPFLRTYLKLTNTWLDLASKVAGLQLPIYGFILMFTSQEH